MSFLIKASPNVPDMRNYLYPRITALKAGDYWN